MILKLSLGLLALVALVLLARLVFLSLAPSPPPGLGATDGRLTACPRLPNCVSSQAKGQSHRIAPITIDASMDDAMSLATRTISEMPGGRVVATEEGYLRAEFTSRLFRFVDDLELLWNPNEGHFDVRSASRVGKSDLGANRRRVEDLRRRLGASS